MVANDKLVLTLKGAREHVTLHFGPNSKVFDVHRTSIGADGATTHTTLFSMSHANLAAMLQEIALPLWKVLTGIVRPLHLDWMEKRKIWAIVGVLPTGDDLSAVSRVRRRRLIPDSRLLAARLWAPEFLDELYDLDDGQFFALVSTPKNRKPRKLGYGFNVTDWRGRSRLWWIPDQRMSAAISRSEALLKDAAARHGGAT